MAEHRAKPGQAGQTGHALLRQACHIARLGHPAKPPNEQSPLLQHQPSVYEGASWLRMLARAGLLPHPNLTM